MLNKLSRKDIELLNILAQTPEGKSALDEYIKQHEKAVKAYKVYRESVVAEVEVEKVVKPVETKRKFKAGDKVRVNIVGLTRNQLWDLATTGLENGAITEVIGYKEDDEAWSKLGIVERPVVVKEVGECGFFDESVLELVEEKSPNELRAEVIQRAKDVLEDWTRGIPSYKCKHLKTYHNEKLPRPYNGWVLIAEFVVNAEKRTVVALLKGFETLEIATKGIAKCHPDDVFNEHIGKAIALGRALGKDVSEFENAVQPNEIVVGHSISSTRKDGSCYKYPSVTEVEEDKVWGVDSVRNSLSYTPIISVYEGLATRPKITDDTHAIYEGGVE
ncbi:MAG TPA: hypothetical protein VIR26_01215 [Metalysinibacillus sp.]